MAGLQPSFLGVRGGAGSGGVYDRLFAIAEPQPSSLGVKGMDPPLNE